MEELDYKALRIKTNLNLPLLSSAQFQFQYLVEVYLNSPNSYQNLQIFVIQQISHY